MASIQARHSRGCDLGRPWTTFEAAIADGSSRCTCQPTYHVVTRVDGKLHRERVGRNRKAAQRELNRIASAEDEGTFVPVRNIRFDEWADRWLAGLRNKPSTIDSYRHTIKYAKQALGPKIVRRLTVDDVKQFLDVCAESRRGPRGSVAMSDSTQAKHLRVLGVCLESAVRSGYSATNPVRRLPTGEKPRARRKEAAYFTNDELPRLFVELAEREVYRLACLLSLKTGMRLGEVSALTWGEVDLSGAVIHVRRSFTSGRLGTPKNHEKREVYVSSDVVEMLGAWWGELGRPGDEALVLPADTTSGYLNEQVVLRRELYPAMARAGIDRVGPTGEKRTFHSFRHTFARLAIESGREMFWLSKHLGHSSLDVTSRIYGHFSSTARQAEARAMEGVFGV